MLTLGYSPWGTGDTDTHFVKLFDKSVDARKEGFDNVSCFLLWGGTDINASFYNEKPHPLNQMQSSKLSERDVWEWEALKECKKRNIPVIGVCRGAQLLCAFNGGKLYQHVNGHKGSHVLVTMDGDEFVSNSCHHQMLDVDNTNHTLLAWTKQPHSTIYEGLSKVPDKEPEIVYFHDNMALAIQGHPEWMNEESDFVDYCLHIVSEMISEEVCV